MLTLGNIADKAENNSITVVGFTFQGTNYIIHKHCQRIIDNYLLFQEYSSILLILYKGSLTYDSTENELSGLEVDEVELMS